MVDRTLKTDTNVTHVKGNVNEEEKRVALQIFTHFVSTREKSYGADVGQRLRLVEVNVWVKDGQTGTGETIFEIVVTKGSRLLSLTAQDAGGLVLTEAPCRYVQHLWDATRSVRSLYDRPVRFSFQPAPTTHRSSTDVRYRPSLYLGTLSVWMGLVYRSP
ncbi:hypothetical protein H0H87_007771 [Tephrocybe sp. NHM501043]|nr:hypothetical protein H0H87_007771 [Tephrocybe sp. NHM501043]